MKKSKIICGDALTELKKLQDESVDCVMTSPPYWSLRDYGVKGQLGLERTFQEYINKLCDIFDEVKRVLKKSGTCWVNLGDTYSSTGMKNEGFNKRWHGKQFLSNKQGYTDRQRPKRPKTQLPDKCLLQIPSRFSIEMTNRGWILRNTIIWHKKNAMPSSVKDRFTVDFEYLFFFVKEKKYWFEQQKEEWTDKRKSDIQRAEDKHKGYQGKYGGGYNKGYRKLLPGQGIKGQPVGNPDKGRNKRTTWTINPKPFPEAHFAVYPEELCETPIRAGCPEEGIVLDPFLGAGTTAVVAHKQNKKFIGIELSPDYIKIAEKRLSAL